MKTPFVMFRADGDTVIARSRVSIKDLDEISVLSIDIPMTLRIKGEKAIMVPWMPGMNPALPVIVHPRDITAVATPSAETVQIYMEAVTAALAEFSEGPDGEDQLH